MQKGYPSSEMDQPSQYGGMDMDENPGRIDGEDAEIDNRIKEILLTSHNLYLIAQMHEKEISELAPHIKDLPQMMGNVIRSSIGELGGTTDGQGGLPAAGKGGVSVPVFISVVAAMSIMIPVFTVLLIKWIMV